MKRKILKWTLIIIITGFFLMTLGLLFLTNRASDDLYDYVAHDIIETRDYYMIDKDEYEVTVVYYPGGLVTAESYLLQADYLAREGIRVIIPKMPLNLAILDRYVFSELYEADDGIWILAGHSLGGASTAYVAQDYPETLDGLIMLAAYPPSSLDLSTLTLPVLSITASEDGVLNLEQFENSQSLLPTHTIYKEIEGGNHAQFGYYGSQRGDLEALISVHTQHEQLTTLILEFIEDLLN